MRNAQSWGSFLARSDLTTWPSELRGSSSTMKTWHGTLRCQLGLAQTHQSGWLDRVLEHHEGGDFLVEFLAVVCWPESLPLRLRRPARYRAHGLAPVSRLPLSLRILLESILRHRHLGDDGVRPPCGTRSPPDRALGSPRQGSELQIARWAGIHALAGAPDDIMTS